VDQTPYKIGKTRSTSWSPLQAALARMTARFVSADA
jgi:hypothetical protein